MNPLLRARALRLNRVFANWSESALEELLHCTCVRHYSKGQRIREDSHDGADVLMVVSGHMVVNRRIGRTHVCGVALIGPGRVLSGMSNGSARARLHFEYAAHDDLMLGHISSKGLFKVLDAHPELWRDLTMALLSQHRELMEGLVEQGSGNATQRLARLLVRLQKLYGGCSSQHGASNFRLRLSQCDLASLSQLSRQTANEALGQLRESGAIHLDYNAVSIVDQAALCRLAGECARPVANLARRQPVASAIPRLPDGFVRTEMNL